MGYLGTHTHSWKTPPCFCIEVPRVWIRSNKLNDRSTKNNKHVVLNQLQDILKDSEDNLSGIVSFKSKNIEYKEVKSYLDARGRPCKDIKFKNFSIKDAKINEATFVKLSSGEWKVIKLEFIKDSSLGI